MTEENHFNKLKEVKYYRSLVEELLEKEIKKDDREFLEKIVEVLQNLEESYEIDVKLTKEKTIIEAERALTETEEERKKRLDFNALPLEKKVSIWRTKKIKWTLYNLIAKPVSYFPFIKKIREKAKIKVEESQKLINNLEELIQQSIKNEDREKKLRNRIAQNEKIELERYKEVRERYPGSDTKALEMIARNPMLEVYLRINILYSKYNESGEQT